MSAHFFGCESVACGYHRDFYAEGKRLKMYMRPNRFRCSTCNIIVGHVCYCVCTYNKFWNRSIFEYKLYIYTCVNTNNKLKS